MKIYGVLDWPQFDVKTDYDELVEWFEIENFVNSYSISLRVQEQLGLSLILPLFVLRHFEEQLSGGFILNRLYVKDFALDDIGYNLLYTPSASRWMDSYFAAGAEWIREVAEDGSSKRKRQFVTEAGVKFRFNIRFSKLRFLTAFGTDFYGIRFGVQNVGAWDIRNMGYIVEVGAGVW